MPINKLTFTVPITEEIRERFMAFVEVLPNGCWLWTGAIDPHYGRFSVAGIQIRHPRAAWLVLRGSIPEGLEPDHTCRFKPCVNPDHMELVTHEVNVQRGDAGKRMRDRTHCPQGHPYDAENTRIKPTGARRCAICSRAECERRRRNRGKRIRSAARCYRGHPFDETNTRIVVKKNRTQRLCRECIRLRERGILVSEKQP